MIDFFKELFTYSHHYNQKLADHLLNNRAAVPEKSVKLFSHVLNAQHIWNSRIQQLTPKRSVWQIQDLKDCKELDRQNYEHVLNILDTVNFNNTLTYVNSKGEHYTNTVRDILFHVVNHSTYHRGQIASNLKDAGIEPLTTDFIVYKR